METAGETSEKAETNKGETMQKFEMDVDGMSLFYMYNILVWWNQTKYVYLELKKKVGTFSNIMSYDSQLVVLLPIGTIQDVVIIIASMYSAQKSSFASAFMQWTQNLLANGFTIPKSTSDEHDSELSEKNGSNVPDVQFW